ncbi:hypothetical protein B296_00015344 [Ensete ventricosum]|uniref:Uncharacterized protein n=1 Tax=Ensete ventricosum TaxID=4639 RepID=A0A426YDL5_ENSVE|nr:hypothetical protein B296_00015344 [Ensete ventricosum]
MSWVYPVILEAQKGVQKVMVNTGMSIDILYFDAFQKLWLTIVDLSPISSTLIGFIGDSITPLGMIVLLVTLRLEPRSKTMMVTFMVVNLSLTYNVILG